MPGPPVAMGNILLPRAGLQGGTYPSKESVIQAIGPLVDLVGSSLCLIGIHKVEVNFMVDREGRRNRARQTLRLTDVAKVSPAVVYWNMKQINQQYGLNGGVIIWWEHLLNTDRDWWILVLQMEPFKGGEALPMMMMECLIYERSVLCGGGQEPRTFEKP